MQRSYLLFESADSCRRAVDVLQEEGVDLVHLHAMAGIGRQLKGLPVATVWQKTELGVGIVIGLLVGGLAGFTGGWLVYTFPPAGLVPDSGILALMTVLGAVFGVLINILTKGHQHNHHLDPFKGDISAGKVLLMADIPQKIRDQVLEKLATVSPDIEIRY